MHDLDYLTVAEVATSCRVSEAAVRKWIRVGRLPAYRVGGRLLRIDARDVAALTRPVAS